MKPSEIAAREVAEKFKVGDRVYINDSLWREVNGWCKIMSISTTASEAILERERCNGHTLSIPLHILDKIASFTEYKLERVGFSQERPKPKKKNGDPFEVGDEVWFIDSVEIRKVTVTRIRNEERHYKLFVNVGGNSYESFTIDGKHTIDGPVALFHQEPVITFKENE